MFKWIGGLIDRTCVFVGALSFSQIPLFMQQYQHHLAGHVSELQALILSMKESAALTGKSLEQYVSKFLSSTDPDFVRQGELMHQMMQRFQKLQEGYEALNHTSLYSKPFLFIRYFDGSIAKSTWASFEMGFSFSTEGMAYAVVGIFFGLFTYWMLSRMILRLFGKKELKTSS